MNKTINNSQNLSNPYVILIENLKEELHKIKVDTEQLLYRISMHSDLARVQEFGSSRIGLSKKIWDKLDEYKQKNIALPKPIIYHEEVIIASQWDDLEHDVLLNNGTLKHKLNIYDRPFFTLYYREKLQEIGKEEAKGENNQGRHYLFLENPKEALHSLWQIHNEENKNGFYFVNKING